MITQQELMSLQERFDAAIASAETEPLSALLAFRKLTETICKTVFENLCDCRTDQFIMQSIIKVLRKEGVLPDVIYLHIQTVLMLTDGAALFTDNQKQQHVKPCMASAIAIVTWYLNRT
jgi:hypothetical protein